MAGTGGDPVTWSRSRYDCVAPGSLEPLVEKNRKPDLWPIIYPTPHPGRPSQSEMGRRGISLGSRACGEGGVSGEIGSSRTPVSAGAALPHASLFPKDPAVLAAP